MLVRAPLRRAFVSLARRAKSCRYERVGARSPHRRRRAARRHGAPPTRGIQLALRAALLAASYARSAETHETRSHWMADPGRELLARRLASRLLRISRASERSLPR